MERKLIRNEGTNSEYTYIEHPSGLRICVWQMKDFSTCSALFGTRYGSVNTTFKTEEDPDFVTVPNGIAHYLEHKLFENEDCNVFAQYAKTGASGNAYTSFDRTCYLFKCTNNFYDSLEILLDFVQDPYFTPENVEKEQGIIGQEIRMYDDNPDWQVFFNLLRGIYVNNPVNIDIAGTVESISEITAELLYKCYNAFYDLHNMVLSIAGDVDVDKIIAICDKHLKPNIDRKLEMSFPDEPDEVAQREVRVKMPVSIPNFNFGYKNRAYDGIDAIRAEVETNIVLSLLADEGSELHQKLYDMGLINSVFYSQVFSGNGFFLPIFGGESTEPMKVAELVGEEIEKVKKTGFDEKLFESVRKAYYGSLVRTLTDADALSTSMMNSTLSGIDAFSELEIVASVTLDDINNCLKKHFDPTKFSISIIEPIE